MTKWRLLSASGMVTLAMIAAPAMAQDAGVGGDDEMGGFIAPQQLDGWGPPRRCNPQPCPTPTPTPQQPPVQTPPSNPLPSPEVCEDIANVLGGLAGVASSEAVTPYGGVVVGVFAIKLIKNACNDPRNMHPPDSPNVPLGY